MEGTRAPDEIVTVIEPAIEIEFAPGSISIVLLPPLPLHGRAVRNYTEAAMPTKPKPVPVLPAAATCTGGLPPPSHAAPQAPASSAGPRQDFPAYATIPEWCRISGVGRSSTYEALGFGHLRAKKLGARTLIDVAHGLAWLDSLPVAAVRPHGAKHMRQAA